MLLNKCKTGDHIAVCKQCNIASIHCLYGIFFSVSLLLCFSISSASEASPAVVWVGKGWLWRRPFSHFTPCFAFPPLRSLVPGYFFFSVNSEFFPGLICPARLVFLLSLELSELSTTQAEVIRLELSRPRSCYPRGPHRASWKKRTFKDFDSRSKKGY